MVRTVLGQYKPEELYTSQKAIQERVNLLCKQKLEARFVSLDSVPIEAITLPARISAAIEAKLSQQQLEQEYEFRLSVASKEAERRKIEAGSIEAYNQTINTSLTPSVLAWQGIQASQELAKSPNAKILLFGSGKNGLPLILNKD